MRFSMYVMMLIIFIVALQCTVNATQVPDSGQDRPNDISAALVTTTTTAAAKPIAVLLPQRENEEEQAAADEEEEEEEEEKEDGEEEGTADAQGSTRNVGVPPQPLSQNAQQSEVKTPTTTAQITPLQDRQTVREAERIQPEEERETDVKLRENAQNRRGQKEIKERDTSSPVRYAVNPLTAEVKTTTTAAVKIISGPEGDKLQDQSVQSKVGKKPDLEIEDAKRAEKTTTTTTPTEEKKESGAPLITNSAAAPTTVTSTAQSPTLPKRSNITRSVNNNDRSSSTSLLFVLTALITLSVITVAPAY